MSLVVESWGLILLCLMAGVLYAGILYYRNPSLQELSFPLRIALSSFRFLVIAFIAFYLLDPLIKITSRETEKPLIVIAMDNSASLVNGKDSFYYKNEFPKKMRELLGELSDTYDTVTYSFGDKVSSGMNFSYTEKSTDISSFFSEMSDRLSNRNVGALILATDGIYNRGSNPLYSTVKMNIPVYALALGDSTVKRDLVLKNVAHNRYAYLGNTFPFEIFIEGREIKGGNSILTVSRNGQALFSQKITVTSNNYFQTVNVMPDAKEAGLHRYRISLSPVDGEVNLKNNSRDVFIEVLDGRQKILILAQSPHPDVAALRSAIELNQNYEVEVAVLEEFNKGFEAYNLVVLHQLPCINLNLNRKLDPLWTSSLPILFVTGSQTDVVGHARLNAGIKIPESKGKTNEVTLIPSEGFGLFELSPEAKNFMKRYPPLTVHFGTYKTGNSCISLFNQKIGMVNTLNPAWAFAEMNGRKTGIIAGEGIWKWKLFENAERGNSNYFNDLISKTIQYLAVKADKSQFRVYGKTDFMENENIELNAEVYNETYELITEPEVGIVLTDEEGKKYSFTFTPQGKSYRLNAGILPPGQYRWEAKTKTGEKILVARGQFSISAILLEQVSTTADHQLLFALSKKNAGELIYPDQMNSILEKLSVREDVKTVSYTHRRLSDLINIRWIFFVLAALMALEWLLRKRAGAY